MFAPLYFPLTKVEQAHGVMSRDGGFDGSAHESDSTRTVVVDQSRLRYGQDPSRVLWKLSDGETRC